MRRPALHHAFLALGIALLAWLVLAIGPGEILAMAGRLGWRGAVVLAPYAAHQLVRAWALHASVVRRGAVRYRDALLVRLSGESAQVLTGVGAPAGEPFKAWLLKEHGLSGPEGLAATLTEYLVYKFVSAAVMVAALAYLLAAVELPRALDVAARVMLVVGVAFLLVAAAAITSRIYLIGSVVGLVARLPFVRRRWPIDGAWVRAMEDLLFEILRERPRRLLLVTTLAGVAHVLLVVEAWWLVLQFDLPSPLFNAWLVDAATKPMGGIFFFVPGQIGTNEAVLAAVFDALGLPAAAGVVVGLARRLRSVIVATVGLAGLWWLDARPRRAGR
jgi:hypothetical protein